jgi:TetR/AcrR family transcriptional repressor of mexJK operon
MKMVAGFLANGATHDQRRAAFVAAAREAFFEKGYAGTTMSAISAEVGGSKTTLWTYFPSKPDLFAAVVDGLVEQYGSALLVELSPNLPVRTVLANFAAAMLATMLSPPIISLYRLVTGEAGRFPELGSLFYERGPKRGRNQLTEYLRSAMSSGRLRQGDPAVAARIFSAMCQANSFQLALLNVEPASPHNIARDITIALDSFLRDWELGGL